MNIQKKIRIGVMFGAALTLTAQADIAGTQFSADMVSRGPDGQTTIGKMYVGNGRMRVEMSQQGREIVRINDQNRHMEWILFPDQQGYIEQSAPEGADGRVSAMSPSAEKNPCEGLQDLICRRVGEEDVAGRAAIKWKMSVTRDGKTLTGAQWLDVKRGLPLKYEMPNGQSMELKFLGDETIGGRPAEKWEMTTVVPNRPPMRTFQWYDPELKLSVREEFPGGQVRALDNIRVGKQSDHLFSVPAGYSRMETPAPQKK